jgi:hypothetical protein
MNDAVEWTNNLNAFVGALVQVNTTKNVETEKGRRFVRVLVNGHTQYFVEKDTGTIYGAKSDVQFNPRREYGTLGSVSEWDWANGTPLPNTPAYVSWQSRENSIKSTYKKRGRPPKGTV